MHILAVIAYGEFMVIATCRKQIQQCDWCAKRVHYRCNDLILVLKLNFITKNDYAEVACFYAGGAQEQHVQNTR